MPISRADAEVIVAAHAERHGAVAFDQAVVELSESWFFPVGFIGSRGVIIDKADGRLSVMGSSPSVSLDDCFWGHRRGFSHENAVLTICRVIDFARTRDFLFHAVVDGPPRARDPWPRRHWLDGRLATVPVSFAPQSYWLRIPQFRALEQDRPFEWTLTAG